MFIVSGSTMPSPFLNNVLDDLQAKSADIVLAALIASDGMVVASSLPDHQNRERIGTIAAAILALGARATHELDCGKLQQMMVGGKHGNLLIMPAGPETMLVTAIRINANLDFVIKDVSRAAQEAERLLC